MSAIIPVSIGKKIRRRCLFFSMVFLLASTASWVMADLLWRGGITRLELAMLIIFMILFTSVALGFVQAWIGFVILLCRPRPSVPDVGEGLLPEELPVTAIVMPIFNEDVASVFLGLQSIYRSVEKTGCISRFDFFVLSDSDDPNKWIEEELAWVELCRKLNGFGRIFYRKRKIPLNCKSGNVSDFCRRWGSNYRHMVILDADSIMTGESLVQLVRLMEDNPRAGIIQTAPVQALSKTFFGRFMQFSVSAYGPIFQAGLNYWQVNDGNYWGHNAIIRVAPFMAHCALPDLPASKTPRAKFISHDYVEAALMRRGKYEVWLAEGLMGSYEGGPPTLIDQAKRDRRWCRGNLQHSWLLFSPSFSAINRTHLFLGVMSYLNSPLWLLFMILGTIQMWVMSTTARRFDYDVGLSRVLDIGGDRLALILAIATLLMLFIPKLLSLTLLLIDRRKAASFGGHVRAVISVFLEHFISIMTAPLCMLFNTQAVVGLLIGKKASWLAQRRGGCLEGGALKEAVVTHGLHTLIGLSWGWVAYRLAPGFFWWMSPIFLGLICSIPLSTFFSSQTIGEKLKRLRLFLTPHEHICPPELAALDESMSSPRDAMSRFNAGHGFMRVVIDPYINAIHISLARRNKKPNSLSEKHFMDLQERAITQGPESLDRREKMALLMNPEGMIRLHELVWKLSSDQLAPAWNLALREYNLIPVPSNADQNASLS